jgi:hypothetical protein
MPRIFALGRAPAQLDKLPAIDEHAAAIDELAFVLATEQLSVCEKVRILEQWRYDMLLIDVAATEGLGTQRDEAPPLQQISKMLSLLGRTETRPQ